MHGLAISKVRCSSMSWDGTVHLSLKTLRTGMDACTIMKELEVQLARRLCTCCPQLVCPGHTSQPSWTRHRQLLAALTDSADRKIRDENKCNSGLCSVSPVHPNPLCCFVSTSSPLVSTSSPRIPSPRMCASASAPHLLLRSTGLLSSIENMRKGHTRTHAYDARTRQNASCTPDS
jgi:hypothetical protein